VSVRVRGGSTPPLGCWLLRNVAVREVGPPPNDIPPEMRERAIWFLSKVDRVPDKNGCLAWYGPRRYGVPFVTFRGKNFRASRIAWFFARGDPGKKFVIHSCENTGCMNVMHMFLGVDKDAATFRTKAGRRHKGNYRDGIRFPGGTWVSPEYMADRRRTLSMVRKKKNARDALLARLGLRPGRATRSRPQDKVLDDISWSLFKVDMGELPEVCGVGLACGGRLRGFWPAGRGGLHVICEACFSIVPPTMPRKRNIDAIAGATAGEWSDGEMQP